MGKIKFPSKPPLLTDEEWERYKLEETALRARPKPPTSKKVSLGLWGPATPILPKRTSKTAEERNEPSRPWQDDD